VFRTSAYDKTFWESQLIMFQLKSIDELKARAAKGEELEKTQLTKIESESQLRAELASLEGSPGIKDWTSRL
jgi:uncharacterized protein with WD repeat